MKPFLFFDRLYWTDEFTNVGHYFYHVLCIQEILSNSLLFLIGRTSGTIIPRWYRFSFEGERKISLLVKKESFSVIGSHVGRSLAVCFSCEFVRSWELLCFLNVASGLNYISSFDWHPTQANRLLTVTPSGAVTDVRLAERVAIVRTVVIC